MEISEKAILAVMEERGIERWEVLKEYREHQNDEGIDDADYTWRDL